MFGLTQTQSMILQNLINHALGEKNNRRAWNETIVIITLLLGVLQPLQSHGIKFDLPLHVCYYQDMKKYVDELSVSEVRMPLVDFLKSYNKGLPAGFPRSSRALLEKYKTLHPLFFKNGDLWSLDEHRKKVLDWIPQELEAARRASAR
jgi:hypothetical protein